MTNPIRDLRISGFVFLALLGVRNVRADSLSLPLGGYFHPGRAMPVRWDISGGASTGVIDLGASGAVAAHVHWTGNPRGTFPWLVIARDPRDVRWRLPDGSEGSFPALHPLADSDFLVASASGDDLAAASLFAGRNLVTIRLPSLEGSAMAWETLDAIMLRSGDLAKIPAATRSALLAAGVELAVEAAAAPDAILPWHRDGRWWIAASDLPAPAAVDDEAYAPTEGWNPGRSANFRRDIFLLGAIYCLVVAGVALWRSRWMPAAVFAASAVAVVVFAAENRRYSPIFRRAGIVRLADRATFDDQWIYQVSHRPAMFRMPIDGGIHPIFFDESQARAMRLALDCNENGRPQTISGLLPADVPLALVQRTLTARAGEASVHTLTTPLRRLASDPMYRGFEIAGQFGVQRGEIWPTLILRRISSTQP